MSLTLLDWRRTVAAMYAAVREGGERDPDATLAAFRIGRERLIREHPQSPIRPEKRDAFQGLDHWPRDPALRFELELRHTLGRAQQRPVFESRGRCRKLQDSFSGRAQCAQCGGGRFLRLELPKESPLSRMESVDTS